MTLTVRGPGGIVAHVGLEPRLRRNTPGDLLVSGSTTVCSKRCTLTGLGVLPTGDNVYVGGLDVVDIAVDGRKMDRSNLEFHFTAVSEDPVEPWMGVIIIGPSKVWNTTFRTGSTSVEAPVLLPPVPALFAPSPANPDVPSLQTVAGFDGVALPTRETGRSGVLPSGRTNTAIVDWDVLDNIAAASTTPGSLAVWASTVTGAEQSRTVLSQAGITVIAERSRAELGLSWPAAPSAKVQSATKAPSGGRRPKVSSRNLRYSSARGPRSETSGRARAKLRIPNKATTAGADPATAQTVRTRPRHDTPGRSSSRVDTAINATAPTDRLATPMILPQWTSRI